MGHKGWIGGNILSTKQSMWSVEWEKIILGTFSGEYFIDISLSLILLECSMKKSKIVLSN